MTWPDRIVCGISAVADIEQLNSETGKTKATGIDSKTLLQYLEETDTLKKITMKAPAEGFHRCRVM